MNRINFSNTCRDVKQKVFYRNGLLIAVACLLVFIYRMTIAADQNSMEGMLIVVPALVAMIFLYYSPKLCIALIIIWIPFRNLLAGGVGEFYEGYDIFAILPEEMKYLDTFLLLILTVCWLSRVVFYREPFKRTPMDRPILIFCSFALVSALGNLTSPIIAITGVRTFLQFAAFYYVIIQLELSESFLKKMVFLYLILAMIQTPISVYNLLSQESYYHASGDLTIGTLKGGANLLAHYEAMMMCFAIGLIKFNPKKKLIYILLFVWYMVSFFTTSGRAALFIFPVAALFVINQDIKEAMDFIKSYFILFLIFIIAISFVLFSGLKDIYYGKNLEELNLVQLFEYSKIEQKGYEGRTYYFEIAWESLNEEAVSPLIGVGPGMFLSNTGQFFEVPLYDKYNLESSKYGYRDEGETLLPADIPVLMTEFGFLGVLAFWYILYEIYRNFKKGVKSFDDPFWKGISAGAIGMILMITVVAVGERTYETIYLQFLLWFFVSMVYKMRLINEKKELQNEKIERVFSS